MKVTSELNTSPAMNEVSRRESGKLKLTEWFGPPVCVTSRLFTTSCSGRITFPNSLFVTDNYADARIAPSSDPLQTVSQGTANRTSGAFSSAAWAIPCRKSK